MGKRARGSDVRLWIGTLLCSVVLIACSGGGGGGGAPPSAGGDSTPPSVPSGLTVTAASSSLINISWNPSTDDTGLAGYYLHRDGTQITSQGGTSYSDTGRVPSTQYCYQVSAYDFAGNVSSLSAQQCATTYASGGGDSTPPSVPGNFTAIAASSSQINLSWTASTDNVGVTGYRIYLSTGLFQKEVASTSTSMTGLNSATQYCYQVSARDAAGNESTKSVVKCATTSVAATPPTAPSSLSATAASSSTINLSWTDNAGNETGFKIERSILPTSGFTQIATTGMNVTTYSSGGLLASTTYYYRVRAYNAAGNSTYSNTANATTLLTTVCTPYQTRCVSGNITAVEACNASGTVWVQSNCPSYNMCSNSSCRTVCDITSAPASPTACMVPNKDNVNNGEWTMWLDPKLAVPTYVTARSVNGSGYAPIYSATGTAWPYAWSIDSSMSVAFNFKLNQFVYPRNPRLGFKAKRSGIINGYVNNYLVGLFAGTATGSTAIASCGWGPVSYSWQNDFCDAGIYGQQLNYTGYWNGMLFSITGDGFGGAIDLMDVNYVYLTVQ